METLMHLTTSNGKKLMLRITTQKKRGKTLLSIEGRLAGPLVGTLEKCWRELLAAATGEKLHLNLCGVSFIDAAGKMLLKEIHRQGGELIAEGCLNQAIVDDIVKSEKQTKSHGRKERPKGSHIVFYVVLFALLVNPATVRAQSSPKAQTAPAARPSEVLRLTLDQAVALGIKQNPTAQIAILTAAESEQDKNIARADLLPQLNARISDEAQKINLRAEFGGVPAFPGLPKTLGPFQLFSAGPSVSAPVFDLTLWERYQAARNTASASRANSLSTREQVILLVVSQYIGTLRAVANVQASQSRVELAQALYDQAADLQKEGVGAGIDTLRANVELQNEKQRLLEAENDRETSLYGLSRLLNLDPRQAIELGDSLSFFDTPQPEVALSMEAALGERQEWKALESQIKAAEYQKKASQDSRLPSLRFDGNFSYVGTSSSTTLPTYTYQASVNLPLFTGGRIQAEIVRSDQARDRFKAGGANNIEVIQAQDSLSRANDNQIAGLYRFNQARADFARAIGQMEKVYAK